MNENSNSNNNTSDEILAFKLQSSCTSKEAYSHKQTNNESANYRQSKSRVYAMHFQCKSLCDFILLNKLLFDGICLVVVVAGASAVAFTAFASL